jgi:hypothetical protein
VSDVRRALQEAADRDYLIRPPTRPCRECEHGRHCRTSLAEFPSAVCGCMCRATIIERKDSTK